LEQKIERQIFQEMLRTNKKLFDDTILNFLPASTNTKEIQTLYEMMRDYPSRGGKGVRGSLCVLFCELFSGKKDNALTTAAALELFQNWILIHDDIEDGSEMRRGQPALHKKFGVELAINAGDALHGKMWELLLTNRDQIGIDVSLDILEEFSRMLNETTEGQQMELTWNSSNEWNIEERDYLLMVTKKSAWYTCITPSRLGLLLSLSEKDSDLSKNSRFAEMMDQTIEFGTNLGIAFQIVDDILNLTADESKYGKEILGDLYEGKRTMMLIHLLRTLDQHEKSKVLGILSKPRHEKELGEMKSILELMRKNGSIDYAREIASNKSMLGMRMFENLVRKQSELRPIIYSQTKGLLEYLTSRDY
jgi:geranylgeranyl diphosphate synthase, type II